MTVSQTFLVLDALGSGEGGQEFGSCPSIGVHLVRSHSLAGAMAWSVLTHLGT